MTAIIAGDIVLVFAIGFLFGALWATRRHIDVLKYVNFQLGEAREEWQRYLKGNGDVKKVVGE